MSLKIFHIVFVSLSIVLCLWFAGWTFAHSPLNVQDAAMGVLSLVLGIALIVYEVLFIKKSKRLKL